MKTTYYKNNGYNETNHGTITSAPAAVLVHQREDHTDVITVFIDGHWETEKFECIGHAMAAIQCPENHFVPAFIDGYPTIINAWLGGQAADQRLRKNGAKEKEIHPLPPSAAIGA